MPNKQYYSDITGTYYGVDAFKKMIQKRFRKQLRHTKELDLEKPYTIIKEQEGDANLLYRLLKMVLDNKLDVTIETTTSEGRIPLYARPMETHVAMGLGYFLDHNRLNVLDEGVINPLRHLTIHECEQLAEILEVAGDMSSVSNEMIEEMHKEHPQTKPSLLKSIDEIRRQLR